MAVVAVAPMVALRTEMAVRVVEEEAAVAGVEKVSARRAGVDAATGAAGAAEMVLRTQTAARVEEEKAALLPEFLAAAEERVKRGNFDPDETSNKRPWKREEVEEEPMENAEIEEYDEGEFESAEDE